MDPRLAYYRDAYAPRGEFVQGSSRAAYQPYQPYHHSYEREAIVDEFPSAQGAARQFPISSVRDEPIVRRTNPHHDTLRAPPSPTSSRRSLLRPEYEKYFPPVPKEVAPGVRADGVLTARHPYVEVFLKRLPTRTAWDDFELPKPRYERELSVRGVLDIGIPEEMSECLFALAALKVARWHAHPAHFALWGQHVCKSTAERVERVMERKPRPIVTSAVWYGAEHQLAHLAAAHESLRHRLDPDRFRGLKRARPAAARADSGDKNANDNENEAEQSRPQFQTQAKSQAQSSAKRRRGPLLTRRKGARHGGTRAKASAVVEPEVVVDVDEEAEVDEDEDERPLKRARTQPPTPEDRSTAPSEYHPPESVTATLVSRAPSPSRFSSPTATAVSTAARPTPIPSALAPTQGVTRRSARLAPAADAPLPNPTPIPAPHLTALVDASNRGSVVSEAASSETCVQETRSEAGAKGKERHAQIKNDAVRRSTRVRKPKVPVDEDEDEAAKREMRCAPAVEGGEGAGTAAKASRSKAARSGAKAKTKAASSKA
ncbi:hypothetical protein EIP86_001239 [Pleurotus ostreatoroseus]|nr:hypothetical protein EIP86_001239 [Pleurotus ostreatoroseus]